MYHAVRYFCPNEHHSNEPTPQKSSLPFPRTQKDKFQQVETGFFYLSSSLRFKKKRACLFLLLASLLLLHDLLDNLLLLNQESADDSVADAVTASGTAVGSLDGLLGLGDPSVLAGAESGDLYGHVCQLLVSFVVVVVDMFRSRGERVME